METEQTTLFNESLNRCNRRPGLLDRFYDHFIASSPEIAEKFKNTNLANQKKMLMASFYTMVHFSSKNPEEQKMMERLSKIHSKADKDIPPHMYDLWLDCLIQTVKEFDTLFSSEIESAWRASMKPGISFLTSRH